MFESISWKEKLPFLVVFLILALLVLMSIPIAFKTDLTYEQKSCILGGGSWAMSLSTCGGYECSGPVRPDLLCDGSSAPGCDCGPGKCWDSIKQHCR